MSSLENYLSLEILILFKRFVRMVTLAAPTAAPAFPSAPHAGTPVDGPGPSKEYHIGDVGVEGDDVEDDVIEDNVGSIAFQRCLPLERLGTALLRLGLVLHLQSSHSCSSCHPSLTCPPCRITSPMVRLLRAHLLRHPLRTPMTTTFLLLLLPGKRLNINSAMSNQR